MTEDKPTAAPQDPADEISTALDERSILHISARTAFVLMIFVVTFTAIMAATHKVTIGTIEASAKQEKMALIGEVLPPNLYENALLDDWVELPPTESLGLADSTRIYRARKGSTVTALVMEAAAPDGYSGRIGLLLAVKNSGELLAMRVTEHRETPGLGDYIVPKKDKNKTQPWITQFNGLSLGTVTPAQWRVKKDGGRFEQRTGATISARAVTNAGGKALAWLATNQDRILTAKTGARLD